MNRRAIVAAGILGAGLAAAGWWALQAQSKAPALESVSPKNGIRVRGLPFNGTSPHPLDGALRLYIGTHKWQTTIPFSPDLHFAWTLEDSREALSLQSGDRILMTWLLAENGPLCVSGADRITADPHAVSARD